MNGVSIALYVHIPFCAARCPYCDFATAPARSPQRARYLAALAREIGRRGGALGGPRVRTLYFGGGTPSLLEPAEFGAVMSAIDRAFDLRPLEFTLEANPATLDDGRLEAFIRGGVTRISLGAQSLHPDGLRALARTHDVEDVRRSVRAVRAASVRSLNLDLIFGWPGQTREAWRRDLHAALALGPDHLSCYPLTLELEPEEAVANWPGGGWGTLARWRGAARRAQPDDDALAAMYVDAERLLSRASYVHYEIANWARPGHRCRHNLAYWRSADWLGVGAGAHSHLRGRRSWNPARLDRYLERWEGRAAADDPSLAAEPWDHPHREPPSSSAAVDDERSDGAIPAEPWEAAALALRLREGLDLQAFARRFSPGARDALVARLHAVDGAGLLRWGAGAVRLTRRGRLLSNEVFVRLLPDAA